jgi:hypothetical protein
MAWIGCMCLVLTFAVASPATAAQSDERDSESGSEKGTEDTEESKPKVAPFAQATGGKGSTSPGKVYTNEDLARLSGSEPAPPSGAPASGASASETDSGAEQTGASAPKEEKSALDQLFERQALREEHKQQVTKAADRVAAAKERIADLEKRALAVKNPFLARPEAPEEGAEEWERGNGPQRLKQTEDQLEAARDELAEAERALAELQSSAP